MKKFLLLAVLCAVGAYAYSLSDLPVLLSVPSLQSSATSSSSDRATSTVSAAEPVVLPKAEPPKPKEAPQPVPVPKAPSSQQPVAASSNEAPNVPISLLEMRIHELINQERAAQGLAVLAWQPALLPVAEAHSSDMAARGYFAHDSPEGEDFSARYKKGGFECRVRIGNTIYLGAENLYQNNRYDSWQETNGVRTYDWNSLEKIAASTVAGWMASPGHRQNILTPFWESEAIGVAFAQNDQILITENFC